MRILHVGFGFRPLRFGGLIAYAEDLMSAQAARGHEVGYFCAGRHYPLLRRPRVHRWTRDGVAIHELLNGPIPVGGEAGTLTPLHELDDPATEALFARTLAEARPEVVHVQELLGLPSSLIDVARAHRVPTVMTLQDYLPLCPTLKLYDADGRVNLRTEVGAQCARCSRAAPADNASLRSATAWTYYARLLEAQPRLRGVGPRVKALTGMPARRTPPATPPRGRTAPPEDYQRRRDVNVERLGRVDRLLAMSTRVEEIYRQLGVDGPNLGCMPLTLSHLAALRPRSEPAPARDRPLHLATINGCASVQKGAEVVIGALERLDARGLSGRVRMTVLGHVDPAYVARLDGRANVRRTGTYDSGELDAALADVDVGIVPSVWEEAYGYVGPELLAKGIPVIGNAIGGIPDYTREGETGWLNRSCSAEELARIVEGILERPEQVPALHRSIVARRPELIRSMDDHADAMLAVYAGLTAT